MASTASRYASQVGESIGCGNTAPAGDGTLSTTSSADSTFVARVLYAPGGERMTARTVAFRISHRLKSGDESIVVGITATRRPPASRSRMFFATNRSATSTGENPRAIGLPYFPVEYLPHGGLVMITEAGMDVVR